MTQLDAEGRALLAANARRRPDLFHVVPDTSGTDSRGTLEVTIDCARRVTGVQVLDVDGVRTPSLLSSALLEAFAAADGARALASLRLSGKAEEWLARADAGLAGERPLQAPRRPDVSLAAYQARKASGASLATRTAPSRPKPGVSENGYLAIQRGRSGDIEGVSVDEAWIGGARPEHLARAIQQAAHLAPRETR